MSKSQERIVAFVFGVTFVVVLILLAVLFPNPTPFQYTTFRIILALAAGGVGAMIPGFLNISVAKWLRAGGAIGVFAIVYFYSPARLTGANLSDGAGPRKISVVLRLRGGTDAECPRLPAAAHIEVVPTQPGGSYPQLSPGGGCRATLIVPPDATGLVRLKLAGAAPFELVNPDTTYQLEADGWEAYVSDTPRMHLLVSLFAYAGKCDDLKGNFETFHTILLSKARSLRSLFAASDHRYDYLNGINVIAQGQALTMSTAEIRAYWEDNGALQVLSGLCIDRPDGDVMRSSIFSGPLSGALPEPLIADLKIAAPEFGTTRDIYTAAMLYALAREARSRRLDQDLVINVLGRAREVAGQIPADAGRTLIAAIDSDLRDAGAPAGLPH